jgi:hypothetical protein
VSYTIVNSKANREKEPCVVHTLLSFQCCEFLRVKILDMFEYIYQHNHIKRHLWSYITCEIIGLSRLSCHIMAVCNLHCSSLQRVRGTIPRFYVQCVNCLHLLASETFFVPVLVRGAMRIL